MTTYNEYGLFIWSGENRYYWTERLDGKTYKRVSTAEKEATKRNARGEHGGNIVVRPRMLIHETRPAGSRGHHVTANPAPRKRARKNPPRYGVTGDGKGKRVVAVLGTPVDIRYVHAVDRKRYEHAFSKSARLVVYADGTVGIVGQRGQSMWGDF